MLRDHHKMEVGDQLAFLDQLIRLCPGNEAAWHAVASMSREGLVSTDHAKMMMGIVNGMFVTFSAFPDFTWEVFDDLIAFQDQPKNRDLLYSQLMELYERAGRPDLSCQARLKFTDELVEQERQKEAILGLATAIMRFPDEGRYVPLMLDRMEELCDEMEGAENDVMNFYRQFLPELPRNVAAPQASTAWRCTNERSEYSASTSRNQSPSRSRCNSPRSRPWGHRTSF